MLRSAKHEFDGEDWCFRISASRTASLVWLALISGLFGQGEDIKYTITAGYCVYSSSGGPVTCTQPSVTLSKLPAFCNLAFTSAASVTVRGC